MTTTKLGGLDALVYEPSASGKFPALIFFVGKGEFGNPDGNVNSLYVHGPAKYIRDGYAPNLVIACVENKYYQTGTTGNAVTNKILDDLIANYKVDPTKIFATGLSAGGANWMNYSFSSLDNAKRIAGYILASAQPPNDGLPGGSASKYPSTPIFINDVDAWVWGICGKSDSFYAKQKALTSMATKGIWTEFPGGHDGGVWDKVYNPASKLSPVDSNIYDWVVKISGPVVVEPPPVKKVVSHWEFILYSDGTADARELI